MCSCFFAVYYITTVALNFSEFNGKRYKIRWNYGCFRFIIKGISGVRHFLKDFLHFTSFRKVSVVCYMIFKSFNSFYMILNGFIPFFYIILKCFSSFTWFLKDSTVFILFWNTLMFLNIIGVFGQYLQDFQEFQRLFAWS